MTSNIAYKNYIKFAYPPKTFDEFMEMLKTTNENNTMTIRWKTARIPIHRTTHNMYWGKVFSASEQSLTKELEGMVNLVAPDTIEGWRTLTYDNISSFRFEGKNYRIV